MSLPSIVINGDQLSDLFFNHEHPARDILYQERDGNVTEEQEREALTKEAVDFCIIIGEDLAEALVNDFMNRR